MLRLEFVFVLAFRHNSSFGLNSQGPAGRDFQLSGISGSGIAKNFGFGSGIGYICKKKY